MIAIINTYNKIRSFIVNTKTNGFLGSLHYLGELQPKINNIKIIHKDYFTILLNGKLIIFDTTKEAETCIEHFCNASENQVKGFFDPHIWYDDDLEIKVYDKNQHERVPIVNFKNIQK